MLPEALAPFAPLAPLLTGLVGAAIGSGIYHWGWRNAHRHEIPEHTHPGLIALARSHSHPELSPLRHDHQDKAGADHFHTETPIHSHPEYPLRGHQHGIDEFPAHDHGADHRHVWERRSQEETGNVKQWIYVCRLCPNRWIEPES